MSSGSSSTDTLTDSPAHRRTFGNDGPLVCPFPHGGDANAISPDHADITPPRSSTPSYSEHLPAPKTCPIISSQEIDPVLIRKSLEARMAYLTDFLNFGMDDAIAISDAAPYVHDIIPEMVDGMYAKLFEFDITKKVFMQRNEGFDGELPKTLEDLNLDSPQIVFRKIFMKSWARRVLTADYTSDKTWAYMNKVGLMHTGVSPFKHQRALGIAPLNVPYRDCALMLGWVQQVLQSAILMVPNEKLSFEQKLNAVNGINKVIWIQNDLFSRHYIKE